jgi:RNA polymerase sigma-70 factor (ECF subfamily)
MGWVRDAAKAEEITARAFAKAFAKRNTFRGASSAYTWLQAIARNEARQMQGLAQALSLEVLRDGLAERGTVLGALVREEALTGLQSALGAMPPKYRRILVARFLKGQSTHEVAEQEGVPLGTVLSRLASAKQSLRRRLQAAP